MAIASKLYAIIAGSGFQSLAESVVVSNQSNRFGEPSSSIRMRQFGSQEVFLLARHGDGMAIPPHAINYRANLEALRLSGVDRIIGLNTVGVIITGQHPGEIAVPNQLIDYTAGRNHSIYDGDSAEIDHIDFTEPFSSNLRQALISAAGIADVSVHDGGVYGVTDGPRLETTAEVDRLDRDGVDYVGMTAMPEASLARELGMEYACLSLLVNYAAGRGEKSIHADIEASTATARSAAMSVVQSFFDNTANGSLAV